MVQQKFFSFYRFTPLQDPRHPDLLLKLQKKLKFEGKVLNLLGTLILAPEGINASLTGEEKSFLTFLKRIEKLPSMNNLFIKTHLVDRSPFQKLKVLIKKEIVTLGAPEILPFEGTAPHLNPPEWNQLLKNPEALIIDVRNDYEIRVGSFKGSKNPHTNVFSEFPEYINSNLQDKKEQPIGIFCTGGIRCEKAGSLMVQQGFKKVFQLNGGIFNYLNFTHQNPQEENLWEGDCFVFDERVSIEKNLSQGVHDYCRACGGPLTPEELIDPLFQFGYSCPICKGNHPPEKLARLKARYSKMDPENSGPRKTSSAGGRLL